VYFQLHTKFIDTHIYTSFIPSGQFVSITHFPAICIPVLSQA